MLLQWFRSEGASDRRGWLFGVGSGNQDLYDLGVKGYRQTVQHRARIGDAKRGKPRSIDTRAKISAGLRGNKNHNWRGGKSRYMNCPQHPHVSKQGRVPKGTFVWEFAHHQFLPRCFVIHHIDGNWRNNDPSNLAPMFPREHNRWHNWEANS